MKLVEEGLLSFFFSFFFYFFNLPFSNLLFNIIIVVGLQNFYLGEYVHLFIINEN